MDNFCKCMSKVFGRDEVRLSEAITEYGDVDIDERLLSKGTHLELKKIDMSVCIESNVDCEFSSDNKFTENYTYTSKLISIDDGKHRTAQKDTWLYCQPRFNHIHASPKGWHECPIPEGFVGNFYYINMGGQVANYTKYNGLNWANTIMFEITGITEGWEL